MYRFIHEQSQPNAARHYPVQVLCQTLGVTRSGYYDWRKPTSAPPLTGSNALSAKATNAQQVKDLFGLHRCRYGSRRLVSEMKDRGLTVSRYFVRKVLIDNHLRPIQPRSFVRQRPTVSDHR